MSMSMKRILKSMVYMGIPFGIGMGIFYLIQTGSLVGAVAGGLFAGVLFGLAMGIFAERQRRKMEITGPTYEGEIVLFQGPANHFQRFEARGGWLILTPRRLSFRSHGKNIQNGPFDAPVASIRSVKASLTLGIIPNRLRIEMNDGSTASFVVGKRHTWESTIRDAMISNKEHSEPHSA
jgi:hypothetical protein